jgi:hypothetical protein
LALYNKYSVSKEKRLENTKYEYNTAMTPTVTMRLYDPVTGLMTNPNAKMLPFGSIPPSANSQIMVIDAVLSGIKSAGGIDLGVTMADISSKALSQTLYYSVLDSPVNVATPTTAIGGFSSGSRNLIKVGFRRTLTSKYVALMIKAPGRTLESGCLSFKWFFGFEAEE